jgi:threonylcarbamoyladenosine tRNA methylthiotransferase MtaB
LQRLRISSIDAVEVDDDLYRLIAEESRLMPHLHISLQAGDDMILKRMKRRHLAPGRPRFLRQGAFACVPMWCSAPTSSPVSRPKRCHV